MITDERDFQNYLKTLGDMRFEGDYDTPVMKGIRLKHSESLKFIGFNCCGTTPKEKRKDLSVHFFLGDYLFERCWVNPNKNADLLKQFKFILSPDFSQYTDMPKAMKVWQHYRKMWLSSYWQKNGLKVIPTACWSDEESFEYCFDGMPKNACIATSSVGCCRLDNAAEKNPTIAAQASLFRKGTEQMIERLTPTQIIWYGKVPNWAETLLEQEGIQLINIKADYEQRFKKGVSQ